MDITPEKSLQVLINLVQRAPLTDAEAIGAQYSADMLSKALAELSDFKKPKNPAPTD